MLVVGIAEVAEVRDTPINLPALWESSYTLALCPEKRVISNKLSSQILAGTEMLIPALSNTLPDAFH